MNSKLAIGLFVAMIVLIGATMAAARPAYFSSFRQNYDIGGTKLDSCNTCHTSGGGSPRNPYGMAYSESGRDFAAIGDLDSDNDGSTNLEEINGLTLPGDPNDYPQDISQTTSGTMVNVTPQQNMTNVSDDDTENTIAEIPVNNTTEAPKSPGFEVIFAVLGCLMITGLKKKYI